MKIFVTDPTGFIGEVLIAKLQEHQQVQQLSDSDCVIHVSTETEISIIQTLLQACVEAQVKRFIHISSTAVYGDPAPSGTITEDSPYLASLSPQTVNQQAIEQLILTAETGVMEVAVLQLGHVYGPGENSETARMLHQMKTMLIPIVRAGIGYCNPIYIDDVVVAIQRACEAPDLDRQRFIIGSDHPITWREMLSSYQAILGEKALIQLPIEYSCNPQDSIPFFWWFLSSILKKGKIKQMLNAIARSLYGKSIKFPSAEEFRSLVSQPIFSNQKARDRLNFQPETSFATGIERTCQWWHQHVR
jgi:nucleoside-diphosphate-sugar epimerase